jgi:hypothetical protein
LQRIRLLCESDEKVSIPAWLTLFCEFVRIRCQIDMDGRVTKPISLEERFSAIENVVPGITQR